MLSPLLYFLYTHDCIAVHPTNAIIKFADDTTLVGLISHSFFQIAVDAIYSVTDAVTWFIVFHFSAMFFPAIRGNRSTPPF